MKKVLLIAILGLLGFNSYSQDVGARFLMGASISYSLEDMKNNSLLSSYYPFDKNFSNALNVVGEFGYFLTSGTVLGIEIGYLSNRSEQERQDVYMQYSDVLKINSSGISINPKYKCIKRFSDKIWFYTDIKLVFQYMSLENEMTQIDPYTNQIENSNMNGNEFTYGLAIHPGMIFKLNKSFGLKMDYSLLSALHSTIKQAENSDIEFADVNAWDYGLNMELSGLSLGVIFTL